jgi:hypothetical protein
MSEVHRSPDDPHWDQVLAIAEALLIDGIYVVELSSRSTQARVDLSWSIREVHRVFRLAPRVHTATSTDPGNRTVTVTITREDDDAEATVNGRARLKVLLRAIEAEPLRPLPRQSRDKD